MHVAVEATRLLREQRGIGRYVRAMLPRMASQRPSLRYTLFVKNQRDVRALQTVIAADSALATRCDVQPVRRMRNATADVFWFPWNVVRPIPRRGPIVVTVHDAVPIALTPPGWRTWRKRRRWWRLYRDTAKHAALMLADSTFTADELVRLLDAPRDRIRVVLLGADDRTVKEKSELDTNAAVARLGVKTPYLLAVGADEPRKNFGVLYRAMERVTARHSGLTLVRVGPIAHRVNDFTTSAPWLHRFGFIGDDDLDALYRRAAVFVCPSTYEGFGLTVLEAMQRGAPVICARASSLPEVAGNGAVFFSPDDDTALTAELLRLLDDHSHRDAMIAAGRAHVASFRWHDTAFATLAAFDDASVFFASPRVAPTA